MNKNIFEKINELEKILINNSSKEEKEKKEKYLLNKFIHYGFKKDNLKLFSKEFLFFVKSKDKEVIKEIIKLLSKKLERDWIYIIIFIFESNLKIFKEKSDLYFIKELIIINSWWDSVDSYAGTILSKLLLMFHDKETIEKFLLELNKSENIWLQRSSLLGQLKFKTKWDFELQKKLILNVCNNKEFWIQKAIGWTLREFTRKNDQYLVQKFVEENKEKLTNLAIRESLRNIKN